MGLTAKRGWQAILASVLVYEIICVEEELLSRGFDRLLEKHPVWPRLAVVAVAAHLINWVPERADPVAALFHISRFGGRTERSIAWGKRALSRRLAARKSSA